MVVVIGHYDASGQHHMTEGIKEAVKAQLEWACAKNRTQVKRDMER
jgi:hypothetical protein